MYHLNFTDTEVSDLSKTKWKSIVYSSVEEVAFEKLTATSAAKSKSKKLSYDALRTQPYLLELSPTLARLCFRFRTRTYNCKANQRSSYEHNELCRVCASAVEDQDHVVNCSVHSENSIDLSRVFGSNIAEDLGFLQELKIRSDCFQDSANEMSRWR